MMPMRKSIKSRVPAPIAAVAAILLVVTAFVGAKQEDAGPSGESSTWFGTKKAVTSAEGGKSGEAFKSALFLFRLR